MLQRLTQLAYPAYAGLAGVAFGLLEHLGYKPATIVTPPFVPPVAVRLAAMLRAGEHDSLRFTLSRLHPDSQRVTLEAMLAVLAAGEPGEQWLERLWQWYRRNRENLAQTALTYGLICYAGIRSAGGWSGKVGDKAKRQSRDALEEAERLLDQALGKQPENADLLCLRLLTARGLGCAMPEHWRRFRALIAVAPTHRRGHLAMLENLNAGSGDSHQAMFRFARGRAGQMPSGHPLRALPVRAHFAMRQRSWQNGDIAAADAWFRQPDVVAEVVAIWDENFAGASAQADLLDDELLNLFAAALSLCGHPERAAVALAQMAGRCLASPWASLARTEKEKHNPGWVVDRVKAESRGETLTKPQ